MLLNPSLSWLLRVQVSAKIQRACHNFRQPRKLIPSVLAVVLGCVWLGNAAISIVFREAYSIDTIQNGILLSLLAYSLWHLLKIAWKRPAAAVEWSNAEQGLVCGGPFSRREVLAYRLTAVISATTLKALGASLLLFSDLPIWPVGFLGILLALAFLELFRMSLQITAFSVPARVYQLFRVVVFGGAAAVLLTAFMAVVANVDASTATASLFWFLRRLFTAVVELRHTWWGQVCEAPFVPFSQLITATGIFNLGFVGWVALAAAMVVLMVRFVLWADGYSQIALASADRKMYDRSSAVDSTAAVFGGMFGSQVVPPSPNAVTAGSSSTSVALPAIRHLAGIGPLLWRQMIAAMEHKFGLLAAMAGPGLLSLFPLVQPLTSGNTFIQVAASLIFYSFLLLPAALKFDFRRDYDRLSAFKMLPMSPWSIVCGQLATPILLTSLFQLIVLTATCIYRPVSAGYIVAACLLLLPANALIVSVENLIFLLYPHRLHQEGIEVFLRTILVFTAKGIFFGVALGLFFAWSSLARDVVRLLANGFGVAVDYRYLFIFGVGTALVSVTLLLARLLVGAFRRFDPSLDAVR